MSCPPPPPNQGYLYSRQCLRANNGIRVIMQLLQPPRGLAATAAQQSAATGDKIRALACRALLGLARDPSIRHILAKLQVRGGGGGR